MLCIERIIACGLVFAGLVGLRAADLGKFSVQEPLSQSWPDEWIFQEAEILPPTNGVYVSDLRVVSESGQAAPAQFYLNRRVLNEALRMKRPAKVGIYFNLSLASNQLATFRITGEGKTRPPATRLHILESGSRTFITNGIYQLEFDSANPQLINAMRCGSAKGTLGHFHWPSNVVPIGVTNIWLDRGPARAVLRRDFKFTNPNYRFDVRYELRAGDPWVQIMDNYVFELGAAMELDLRPLNARVVDRPSTENHSTLQPEQRPIVTLGPLWRTQGRDVDPFAFIYSPEADYGLGLAAVQASGWNCRSDITMESQHLQVHGDREQEGQVRVRLPVDGAHRSWALVFGPPEMRKRLSHLTRARADITLDRVLSRWALRWESKAPDFKLAAAATYLYNHFNQPWLSPTGLPRTINAQLDDALKLKHVKSRDLAALAYIFTNPDYAPAPDDYAWKPAHPHHHTALYSIPLKIGLLMPEHPESTNWVRYGVRETYRNLMGDSFPGGAWAESPGYAKYVFEIAANMELLRTYGVTNGFASWPRWKEVTAYLNALHTPEDPRYGAPQVAPIGETSPGNYIEQLRKLGQMEPELDSREFPGFGAILRGQETFVAIKAGPARSHFQGDELAFHFCALGTPLVIDHASPDAWSAALHNRPDLDGKSPIAVAEPRLFKTSLEADLFVADERSTNVSHVPMEANSGAQYPQTPLTESGAWKMRRYVLLVKHDPAKSKIPDYLAIRDEIISPEPVGWNLHALARDITGEAATFVLRGQLDVDLTAHFVAPQSLKFEKREWSWGGGKAIPESFQRGSWKLEDGEHTQWLRAHGPAGASQWFVLLVPNRKGKSAPKIDRLSPTSARVSVDDEAEIVHLGTDALHQAAVERAGKTNRLAAAGSLQPLEQTEFAAPEKNLRKPRF